VYVIFILTIVLLCFMWIYALEMVNKMMMMVYDLSEQQTCLTAGYCLEETEFNDTAITRINSKIIIMKFC